ncbi:hypothetical protein [Oceaniradius stylonematis]|uniref:hypothetical protein n=1 Tax=Oceaniradius stylonematis TaxID=2184161 RepID=UPI003B5BC289
MAHVLDHVGAAIVEAIKAADTEVGKRVGQRRFFPQSKSVRADAIVFAGEEDVEAISQAPVTYDRTVAVSIVGRFKGGAADVETRAYRFQIEIEEVMASSMDLGGLAQAVFLRRSSTSTDGSGASALLYRTIEYAVIVSTRDGYPETAI